MLAKFQLDVLKGLRGFLKERFIRDFKGNRFFKGKGDIAKRNVPYLEKALLKRKRKRLMEVEL